MLTNIPVKESAGSGSLYYSLYLKSLGIEGDLNELVCSRHVYLMIKLRAPRSLIDVFIPFPLANLSVTH